MRQGCRIGAAKDGFTASAEIAIRSGDFSWSRAPTGSRFSGRRSTGMSIVERAMDGLERSRKVITRRCAKELRKKKDVEV